MTIPPGASISLPAEGSAGPADKAGAGGPRRQYHRSRPPFPASYKDPAPPPLPPHAAAILLHWGILERNDPFMNTSALKTYLIRGAKRNPALTYPNREFGYGTLDLYQAFLRLRL